MNGWRKGKRKSCRDGLYGAETYPIVLSTTLCVCATAYGFAFVFLIFATRKD